MKVLKTVLVVQTCNKLGAYISIRDGATGEEFEAYQFDYKNDSIPAAANTSLRISITKAREVHAADKVIVDSNVADVLRKSNDFALIDEVCEDIYAD
jgi:hypothetical protein